MICDIVRYTVELQTGETVSRETIGRAEIAERDYMRAISRIVTGMSMDDLASYIEANLKETKSNGYQHNDHRHGCRGQTARQAAAGAGG